MESDVEIFQMLELSSEAIKAAIKAMVLNIKKKKFIMNKQEFSSHVLSMIFLSNMYISI